MLARFPSDVKGETRCTRLVVSLVFWEEEEEREEALDGRLLTGCAQGSAGAGLQKFLV